MDQTERVRALVEAALLALEDKDSSITSVARQCIRIATLRHDYANELWLHFELTTTEPGAGNEATSREYASRGERLRGLFGVDGGNELITNSYQRWEANRSVTTSPGSKPLISVRSIALIEAHAAEIRRVYDESKPAANLSPAETARAVHDASRARTELTPLLFQSMTVLEAVRGSLHDFLVSTERELDLGQQQSSIFERAQAYVNAQLAAEAPEALAVFVAAQDRIVGGTSEELSQALGSCRRMIKALADAFYPATGETVVVDGVARVMDDAHYRNRLTEFVRVKLGKSTSAEVLKATLSDLGSRLTALDNLASKGVHTAVSVAEAEMCVVWTYLLAADLIRINEGQWLVSSSAPKPQT